MKKVLYWFFVVLSLGTLQIYAVHKARKQIKKVSDKIEVSGVVNINVLKLIDVLGGKENIVGVTSTINTIKVLAKNAEDINIDSLRQFKPKGIISNKDSVTMVFGNNSSAIAHEINQHLGKKND
ncbi:MAG: hypothetical protein LBM76_00185 [Mycoplasmataceae bacterium]|jgi:phosphotransferase system IIB component|nr:hypothetical protein [Mycoplasmataceae bacterium]